MKEQIRSKKCNIPEEQDEHLFDGSPFGEARNLYAYRDLKNCLDTARRKGVEEGMHQVKIKQATLMLNDGLDIDKIAEYTGLSKEEVEQLRNSLENDRNE